MKSLIRLLYISICVMSLALFITLISIAVNTPSLYESQDSFYLGSEDVNPLQPHSTIQFRDMNEDRIVHDVTSFPFFGETINTNSSGAGIDIKDQNIYSTYFSENRLNRD